MAWRFNRGLWVKEGTLDNRVNARVTGEIEFASLGRIELALSGNFEPDFQGRKVRFQNPAYNPNSVESLSDAQTAEEYFALLRETLVENKIVGNVKYIGVDPFESRLMCIEFYNGKDSESLFERCVIGSFQYTIL